MNEFLNYFPSKIKNNIEQNVNKNEWDKLEEIRIRINQPIILKIGEEEIIVKEKTSREEINEIMQKICENSLYSYQKQIAAGYITVEGGHRVGIVGNAVMQDEKVNTLTYISSLNFRISKQVMGCGKEIVEQILNKEKKSVFNTLIVSPPGVGKTTLIRDIVRIISDGFDKFNGITISVIDERGEISASNKGIAQNNLGLRTDIFTDIPKAIGMKMVIRSMAPKVIVADEIGSSKDAEAIKYAVCCGVKGIFTAHGNSIEELKKNPELNTLITEQIFERIILLKERKERAFIIEIYEPNTQEKKYEKLVLK